MDANHARRIEFGELLRSISGKIRRVRLRRQEVQFANNGVRPTGEFREEGLRELRG